MSNENQPTESPLAIAEKESEEFRKNIEENIKVFSKIDLKSKNKDKVAYKEALEDAIKQLDEEKSKSEELTTKLTSLKKEDEASTLKEKDFTKRQTVEVKRIKDIQEKIDKLNKKLKQDLDKQQKADEKEEAKKQQQASSTSTSTLKNLISFKPTKQDEKSQEQTDTTTGETEPVKGLKELVREERIKFHEAISAKEAQLAEAQTEKKKSESEETKGLKEMISNEKKKNEEEKKEVNEDESEEDDDDNEDLDEEEEEEEEIDEEHETKSEPEKKSDKKVETKLVTKAESKPDVSQPEESKEKKKSESIFFGLFKSKSANTVAKDVVKKLEGDEAKPKETPKIEEKQTDNKRFNEGDALIVIENFVPEYEDDDLPIKKDEIVYFIDYGEDDPNWIEVKNKSNKTGFVPIKNVERHESIKTVERKPSLKNIVQKSAESKRSGKELWSSANIENLKEKGIIEGSSKKIPENFTDSFLCDLVDEQNYSYENYLKPKLTESNLNFKNLYWESKENKIRNKIVSFQKTFIIHKCTNIPMPSKEEMTILSRKVRICLFDGESVLSNIHTIEAHLVGKDERNWIFEDEFADSISILDFSEFFVRVHLPDKSEIPPSFGILFELSIYCKINETNEECDICCGWAHLPFFDPTNKQQIVNKSYDLPLRGGSILENINKPIPTNQKNLNSISDIVNKIFKESKIKFNVKEPNNYLFDILNSLPDPLISSTIVAPFIKYFREQLGEELVAPLIEIGSFDASTEPIHDIFLATFPFSLNHPDIIDQVKTSFTFAKENMRRDEKNDNFKLRKTFIKIYNETCYPLLFHSTIPGLSLSNQAELETRTSLIKRGTNLIKKDKVVEYLLDSKEEFEPFLIDELRYEIFT